MKVNKPPSATSCSQNIFYKPPIPTECHKSVKAEIAVKIVKVDSKIINKAVELKQQLKLSIGDALIAATAIVHNLELVTRNTKDFEAIKGLRVSNPLG